MRQGPHVFRRGAMQKDLIRPGIQIMHQLIGAARRGSDGGALVDPLLRQQLEKASDFVVKLVTFAATWLRRAAYLTK